MEEGQQTVELSVDLLVTDIITIEDNANLFRPTFQIVVQWQDNRLRFQNLLTHTANVMSQDEQRSVWRPKILIRDTNQQNRLLREKQWCFTNKCSKI